MKMEGKSLRLKEKNIMDIVVLFKQIDFRLSVVCIQYR